MKLGNIPSLTWNKLNMNAAELPDEVLLNTRVETRFESLPEGIHRQELTYDDAMQWLADHAPEQAPEAVQAGKTPIYHPQEFATGLGAEFDEFLATSNERVELFEVADGITTLEPLQWSIDFQNGNQAATAQIVHVGKGASLTLVMSYRSGRSASGTAAVSTKVVLDDGARLSLVKAQMLGDAFTHMDDIGVSAAENATLDLTVLELGGSRVYHGMQTELIGARSCVQARVGYIARKDHLVDMNYSVVQRGKATQCEMSFDGVIDDQGHKRLSDTIDFRRGAKGAYGHEKENVLLLGDNIVNQSLPVILCEEEDMEGSHGATIGRLDDDMLFYMASRGIDEQQAEQIMVRARLSAVARNIPGKALRDEIHDYIEDAFKA